MKKKLSLEQIDDLVNRFKNKSLAKEEWTHEAHLIVGLWFVQQYDFFDAVCQIKSGIMTLNASFGGTNDGNSGYHETMTVFWAKVISLYVSLNNDLPLEERVSDFLETPLTAKTLPFEFYERELLLSSPFRAVFHEPGIKVIDKQAISDLLNKS